MVKSVWQMTGCEDQFVPGPLCVQPEMLSLLGSEPREGSCVITSCTVVMGVDHTTLSLSTQLQPLPTLISCVTVS